MCYHTHITRHNLNRYHNRYYSIYCLIEEFSTKLKRGWKNKEMNIVKTESQFVIKAKTSGYNKNKRIRYYFVESVHTLCLDKMEIILAQIQACERLLKYTKDDIDVSAIKKEILELKFTLDLIQY